MSGAAAAGAGTEVRCGGWTGSLPALLSAFESGAADPRLLDLRAVVAQVRTGAGTLEEASEACVLLARAAEWKARALLPVPPAEPPAPAGGDGAAEPDEAILAERVAAYHAFSEAAEALRAYEHRRRAQFSRPAGPGGSRAPRAPEVAGSLDQLLELFGDVWTRSRPRSAEVQRERFTVAEALAGLRDRLRRAPALFASLFAPGAGRLEVVVTFLALLELVRRGEVQVRQESPFAPVELAWNAAPRGGAAAGDGPA